ncbi:hypothetical protein OG897_13320 [Streptomyces sp. NBC_00237]|uniref:hypothetical protein n=1 Tax=Streptomyces sp. NBC_00237 TaxID=2975687 RepID=UPI0022505DFE|nr:hypothetical protein [Streptomyces sp. NBC_00237]MCX5202423.1 hypothetical protein [Streptomyces sp. NBC_00237]
MTQQPNITDDLRQAREAIENLINIYFDNVPVAEMRRDELAECIHEGLSDEFTRLYRIAADRAVTS